MLEGLLLLIGIFMVTKSIDIQAHIPGNAALSSSLGETRLGVDDRVSALSGLNKLRILFFENSKILLSFPVPDTIGGKEKVHFFESALVRFRVQAVDHGQCDDVGNTEDVVSLLLKRLEDDGKNECEPAIANGPTHDTPSITLCTNFQWEDLGRVKPWDGQPGGAEGGCEEENHSDGTGAVASGERRARRMLKTSSRQTTS